MKLCVLLSCMHQKDASIIDKSNIQTDVVVVNQCDEEKIEEYDFYNKKGNVCHAKMIYTKDRGLSRSRNTAIENTNNSDVCLICDDDELFEPNYETVIIDSFEKYKDVDIIIFGIKNSLNKCNGSEYDIGLLTSGSVSSIQIAFRLSSILKANIKFDVLMGSGTGNGDGEEVKFIVDCLKSKLKIRNIPIPIVSVIPNSESQWFKGYTKKYFFNKGWSFRRIYGIILSYVLIWRFLFRKYKRYNQDLNFVQACIYMHKGFLSKK